MKLSKGQLIKTTYGNWYTVLEVWDNVITTYEGNYIHTSNVIEVR